MKHLQVSLKVMIAVLAISFSGSTLMAQNPASKLTGPVTKKQLVAQAKKVIKQITPKKAEAAIKKGEITLILDVREPAEYKAGHLPNAINLPRGLLEFKITKKVPDTKTHILVYCKSGGRGSLSTQTLQLMGYKNAINLNGGWKAWKKAGLKTE